MDPSNQNNIKESKLYALETRKKPRNQTAETKNDLDFFEDYDDNCQIENLDENLVN